MWVVWTWRQLDNLQHCGRGEGRSPYQPGCPLSTMKKPGRVLHWTKTPDKGPGFEELGWEVGTHTSIKQNCVCDFFFLPSRAFAFSLLPNGPAYQAPKLPERTTAAHKHGWQVHQHLLPQVLRWKALSKYGRYWSLYQFSQLKMPLQHLQCWISCLNLWRTDTSCSS